MKEWIRNEALRLGADVCGVAGIERFGNAPDGFSPTDIVSSCRSVISFGIALPKGLLKVDARLIYQHYNELVLSRIDSLALALAKAMELKFKCVAVPMPSDSPYEYWDAEQLEGRGLISMKHMAVNAGLGTIGKNTLLLSKKFGNRLNIGAVLTDLHMESDRFAESVCIEGCRKCIENCPVGAIRDGTVIQKLCREYTYGKTARGYETVNCNRCRTVCPVGMGEESETV